MYEIHDIRELDGATRKEEWVYRIGRQVEPYLPLETGNPLILVYPGEDKFFRATVIQDVLHDGCYVKVSTQNTLYILKEVSM